MEEKTRLTMDEMKEKFHKETVKRLEKTGGLTISRVPRVTLGRFKGLAQEHFNDDYGLTLMYLVNSHDDAKVILNLVDRISDLQTQVSQIQIIMNDSLMKPNVEEVKMNPIDKLKRVNPTTGTIM